MISPSTQQKEVIFYETVTYGLPCTVTLQQYLALCENTPEGYERSLQTTRFPTQFDLNDPELVEAVLNHELVVQPVLLHH